MYKLIADTLGSDDVVHISDMNTDMIATVAVRFQKLLEEEDITACSQCVHAGSVTNIGLIRCKLTGKPFCSTCNEDTPLSECNFKEVYS